MTTFTLDDMRQIMTGCAGVPDSVDLTGDIGDLTFTDLGYDSLAVLEMAARIQQRLDIPIPDDAVGEMKTPQAAVDYVNRRLTG
ncbi:actinorhodin polyketide synthase acyl carrier protein [Sphaerisporangium rufum]|uniref:Actinorhodin polyketide synthase acyl carrier protein n=1 Tax=Sphaerisporangium rufum TaxID=1381558 RepID=A0A919R5R7_9ACTN|nr:acyl carrier protein [Sphaerisporangium rufum]GII78901.1 actinorhodin polyketide synthase acyl carrier protein [Sphaerisporangium rufum]